MFSKTAAVAAIAALLTLGTAGVAAASTPADPPADQQPAPPMVTVFYFGTQTYCMQAAAMGQQMGVLTAGRWQCDSGWLMVVPPVPPQAG